MLLAGATPSGIRAQGLQGWLERLLPPDSGAVPTVLLQ